MTASIAPPPRILPFSPGGATFTTVLSSADVSLIDLSNQPRFGFKGRGSSTWLGGQGVDLPRINRIQEQQMIRLLRLGSDDFACLAENAQTSLETFVNAWSCATGTRGYSSWCEERWAWMRLSGSGASITMSKLCAVDLRTGRFAADEIAQTRLADVEAVVFRSKGGFDMLFDITAAAYFTRAVSVAAKCEGRVES